MSLVLIGLLGLAFVVAYLLHAYNPDMTETVVEFLTTAWDWVAAIVGVAFILLFLASGVPWLMFVGFVMAVLAFAGILTENNPLADVINRIIPE